MIGPARAADTQWAGTGAPYDVSRLGTEEGVVARRAALRTLSANRTGRGGALGAISGRASAIRSRWLFKC